MNLIFKVRDLRKNKSVDIRLEEGRILDLQAKLWNMEMSHLGLRSLFTAGGDAQITFPGECASSLDTSGPANRPWHNNFDLNPLLL